MGDHIHVHDADEGEGSSCSMSMIFHGGHCETILFTGWMPMEIGPFIGSTIAIFVASLLYEGLKYYREIIYAADARQQLACLQQTKEGSPIIVHKRTFRESITNKYHLIQTVLHLIQVAVSYLLMLVAMTYNVWLFLAIVLGAATGYFFFGWIKSTSSSTDFTEHCH